MKKITIAGMFAFAVCFGFGCDSATKQEDSVEMAEEANEERLDSMDASAKDDTTDLDDQAEFMVEAASAGMMEVELGNMAANQATNPEVKNYAKMMVTDHTKANEELKALAAAKNIILPTRVGKEHQDHIDKMSQLKGAEFDRHYMNMMVKDHEDYMEEFREAGKDNEFDAEVKAFTSKLLTTLDTHLQKAKKVNDLVKDKNATTTTTTKTTEAPKH